MRPFSPEVSRDKWADWWVYKRVGLTCPWLLSISSSNGWPGFLGEETGKDPPHQSGQPGGRGPGSQPHFSKQKWWLLWLLGKGIG